MPLEGGRECLGQRDAVEAVEEMLARAYQGLEIAAVAGRQAAGAVAVDVDLKAHAVAKRRLGADTGIEILGEIDALDLRSGEAECASTTSPACSAAFEAAASKVQPIRNLVLSTR